MPKYKVNLIAHVDAYTIIDADDEEHAKFKFENGEMMDGEYDTFNIKVCSNIFQLPYNVTTVFHLAEREKNGNLAAS